MKENQNTDNEEIQKEVQNMFCELICSSPCINDFFDCDLRIATTEELNNISKIENNRSIECH